MTFSERASEPTSVVTGRSGTRRDRSPWAMAPAVDSMRRSGRSARCTMTSAIATPATVTVTPVASSTVVVRSIVDSVRSRGSATVTTPSTRPVSALDHGMVSARQEPRLPGTVEIRSPSTSWSGMGGSRRCGTPASPENRASDSVSASDGSAYGVMRTK